jgi:hypothetical protein
MSVFFHNPQLLHDYFFQIFYRYVSSRWSLGARKHVKVSSIVDVCIPSPDMLLLTDIYGGMWVQWSSAYYLTCFWGVVYTPYVSNVLCSVKF